MKYINIQRNIGILFKNKNEDKNEMIKPILEFDFDVKSELISEKNIFVIKNSPSWPSKRRGAFPIR